MSIMKAYRIVNGKLHSHVDKCIVSRPGRFLFRGGKGFWRPWNGRLVGLQSRSGRLEGEKNLFPRRKLNYHSSDVGSVPSMYMLLAIFP